MNPYLKSAARNLKFSALRIAIIAPFLLIAAAVACGDSADEVGTFPIEESAGEKGTVVAEGLTSPRGLAFNHNGHLIIAETGGGRLLEVTPYNAARSLTEKRLPHALNTGPDEAYRAGPSAISIVDGELYFIVGEFRGNQSARLFRLTEDADYEPVTPATDAFSPTSNRFSNPYDIIEAPEVNGWIVSDPGGNSLVKVDFDGTIKDYVIFENFNIPDHEPPVEMVPTGITRGPDGAVYVGSLTGYPYPRGEAVVWRVEDLNDDGDAMDEGEVEAFATGFTTITDITFGPDGTLYVGEFSSDTKTVFAGGDFSDNAIANPGRVLRWIDGETTVMVESVVSPTGLLTTDSTLYISEEYAGVVTQRPTN